MRLGAHPTPTGTHFAVRSSTASSVELCLFDGDHETRLPMQRQGSVWHVVAPGVGPGQRYGYRTTGPFAPARGCWHNPAQLLLDPYARAIDGYSEWHPATLPKSRRDSAPFVPRSVVTAPQAPHDWQRPQHAPDKLVVYEAHVKGLTRLHPDIPPAWRGTYRALGHPALIEHLTALGVTALELLPLQAHVDEHHLLKTGRTNYWGYAPISFFAPHRAYAHSPTAQGATDELIAAVHALHAAGIEVWLDVVYNHTGEGGMGGPSLCYRGLDDALYYRRTERHYDDVTGTGNTLATAHPAVQDLVCDSLAWWHEQLGIDGFRFDLAMTLCRDADGVDMHSAMMERLRTDPRLRTARLVAEPWDLGPDGYGVGRFPQPWLEWNGAARDALRDLWRGEGSAEDAANALQGSPDRYDDPLRAVSFITCHDGFTLHDLVRYAHKHNRCNGEDNRDGSDDNRSHNHGVEGPSDDPHREAARQRTVHNLLASLFFAAGVPMLTAGDELGRTQRGNNNAYCQDNALSWLHWDDADTELLAFVQQLTALRRAHPDLSRGGGTVRCEERTVWLQRGETLVVLNAGDAALDPPPPPHRRVLSTAPEHEHIAPRSVALFVAAEP